MTLHRPTLLRRALAADAIASGLMGALLIAAAEPLADRFHFQTSFLFTTGLFLLPWAAWVGWLATRTEPPRVQAWAVVVLNALWVVDSVLLLLSGWGQPSTLGTAFVIAQAVAVGIFAECQFIGLRRASLSAA